VSLPRRGPRLRPVAALTLVGALALTACGGDPAAQESSTQDATAAETESGLASENAPDLSGDPPEELVVETLAPPPDEGAPEAAPGDVVAVDYTGRAWSTGEVFDSSEVEGRTPITFQLGAGRVIPGWDQGIVGLQVGERARLIIPPDLAYGDAGAGSAIGPGETLVFDVELVEVLEQPTGGPTGTDAPSDAGTEAAEG
jgi:peptidylprolyl isomerase